MTKVYDDPNRECTSCRRTIPDISFYSDKYRLCSSCCRKSKRKSRLKYPELDMFNSARARARKYDVPFTITQKDIKIPTVCPILEIPLIKGVGKIHAASPSLDRKIPKLGYTPENVWVISARANILKSDGTSEEFLKVIKAIQEIEGGDL